MKSYKKFNREFFEKHQRKILWLINTRIGRWLFRVEKMGHRAKGKTIDKITPNSIRTINRYYKENDKWFIEYNEQFFGRDEYGRKLCQMFFPIWWLMHIWDLVLGDRILYPDLSFGFEDFYPDANVETTTVDGHVFDNTAIQSWAQKVANAGNGFSDDGVTMIASRYTSSTTTDRYTLLQKSIELFNVSSITVGNIVSAVSLFLWGVEKTDGNSASANMDYNVYVSAPASNTALAEADFQNILGAAQSNTAITYSAFTAGAYNESVFNTTGIATVQTAADGSNIVKLGTRPAYFDVAGNTPPWVSGATTYMNVQAADNGSNKPKLTVTHSAAAVKGYPPTLLFMNAG